LIFKIARAKNNFQSSPAFFVPRPATGRAGLPTTGG